MNYGDITKIDERQLPKDIDLITYGFPCQDISLAGKQKGLFNEDGSQTRSGLFFEALRIIEETQPKVAIAENVKNLTSKKFAEQFKIVLDSLEDAGYNNYWKVLNAKDFGVPQNRERVFIVSIRKDIDTGFFRFPEGFPLELRLKDVSEDVVDEKYYLNTDRADGLVQKLQTREVKSNPDGVDVVGDLWEDNGHGSMAGRVYNTEGQCPTLGASHFQQIKYICVKEATKTGYAEAYEGDSINLEQPNSKTRRGRVGHGVAQTLTTSPQQAVVEPSFVNGDICRTVRSGGHGSTDRHSWDMVQCNKTLRIRKLTPKECFRLMDFDDADFEKAEAVNSNTQLYKQAGNGIVVAVPQYIIKALVDAGIFGGVAKPIELPEGQISFADCASFDRYIETYSKGEENHVEINY
jgi:DNA (cytosine-5)-methyltransferase 1